MTETVTFVDELDEAVVALLALLTSSAPGELSRTAASVLRAVAAEPARVTVLAAAQAVAQPTMTVLVDRLEARGYVRREPDPADRRATLVHATDAGRAAVDARRAARARVLADRVAALPAPSATRSPPPSPPSGTCREPPHDLLRQPRSVYAVAFAAVVAFMGIGLVDPILSILGRDLDVTHAQVELRFTSYLAITAVAVLVSGLVAGRRGARRTLLTGLALVVVFATLAGLSGTIAKIAGFRAGWGPGSALLIATATRCDASSPRADPDCAPPHTAARQPAFLRGRRASCPRRVQAGPAGDLARVHGRCYVPSPSYAESCSSQDEQERGNHWTRCPGSWGESPRARGVAHPVREPVSSPRRHVRNPKPRSCALSRARTPQCRLIPLLLTCAVAVTMMAIPAAVAPTPAVASIKQGSSGKAVKTLQRKLRITADGKWGPATTRALKRYQRRNGLTATGRLDTQTRQKLGYRVGGSSSRTGRGVTMTPDLIEQVQTALGITADGEWGPQSARALKAYETQNGLPADGVIDADVLTKMGIDPAAASAPTTTSAPVSSENPKAQALVDAARAQIGVPYASGGTTPAGFDCSGLTVYAAKQAGIKLPRTSFEQYKLGTSIPKEQIQAGDFVFFDSAGAGASHVGIATSPTTVISATTRGVMEHKISDAYWGSHYVGAKRITG